MRKFWPSRSIWSKPQSDNELCEQAHGQINTEGSNACVLNHLAVIMDGNGRWAKKRLLPRQYGHKVGADNLKELCKMTKRYKIKYLTVYAFSTENWRRPQGEVEALMRLFVEFFKHNQAEIIAEGIKILFCGEREGLPQDVLEVLQTAESESAHCTELQLIIAFNYGGRQEVVSAVKALLAEVTEDLDKLHITEQSIRKHLYLPDVPDPDLILRPSGEYRLSNFLLWQAAYAELVFLDVLWPDFSEIELAKALLTYSQRERRFGTVK